MARTSPWKSGRATSRNGRAGKSIDRLEVSFDDAAATRDRLLGALLAEALAPAEDRDLEAAE